MPRVVHPMDVLKDLSTQEAKTLRHYLLQLDDRTRKEWLDRLNVLLNYRSPGNVIVLHEPCHLTDVITAFKKDHPSRVTPMDDPEGIATLVAWLLQAEGTKYTEFTLSVDHGTITIDTDRGEVFQVTIRSLGYQQERNSHEHRS